MLDPTQLGSIILLIFISLFVEKIYVSRTSVLPNLFLILPFFIESWNLTPTIFQFYIGAGVLLGIGAFLAYLYEKKIPKWLYNISYPLYSLKTLVGIYIAILFLGITNLSLGYGLIISLALWFIGVKYCDNKLPKLPWD